MVYNKDNYNRDITSLIPKGFIRIGNYCQFERKFENRIETIYYSHRDYFPHGFYIDGVSASIYFNEVEEILEQYGLAEEFKSTFGKTFQDLKDVDYKILSTEINSEETFSKVKGVIEDVLENGVLPFFSHFTTLEEIACFLADKEAEEIVPYIQGSILLPKTVLIMKLVKHPDFKKRLVEFRNVLLGYVPKNNRYQILLNKYDALFAEDLNLLIS